MSLSQEVRQCLSKVGQTHVQHDLRPMARTVHDLWYALCRNVDRQIRSVGGFVYGIHTSDAGELAGTSALIHALPVSELGVLQRRCNMNGEEVAARARGVGNGFPDCVAGRFLRCNGGCDHCRTCAG